MPELHLSVAHCAARSAASIALADAGEAASCIRIYTAAPANGGVLLAEIALQKPCGTIIGQTGGILLAPDLAAPTLCCASGQAAWGEWVSGAGDVIAAGAAAADGTPAAETACFIISGTQPGSAQLWEGGTLSIAEMILG